MNLAAWNLVRWASAWLGIVALQATLVSAALLLLERIVRDRTLRGGLVWLAMLKFAVPPWLAWPLPLVAALPGAASSAVPPALLSLGLPALWALGSLVALVFFLAERLGLERVLAEAEPCHDERVSAALRRATALLGLRETPRLRISTRAVAPFTAGVVRPIVILPRHWLRALSSDDLETLLLHEVAHVRRRDALRLELAAALGVLWWWNPIFRWASARWRLAIEEGCDDLALARGGANPEHYGALLLRAARLVAERPASRRIYAAAAGMSASALEHRLHRILSAELPSRLRFLFSWAALAALTLLAIPYAGRQVLPLGEAKHPFVHMLRHGVSHHHHP